MNDELRWYLLRKKNVERMIVSAFEAFRKAGVEPILIKGWAAALNYPPHKPRFFGDIDLAVASEDFEQVLSLTETKDSGASGIDLHRELRHLDTVAWSQLAADSQLVDLEGAKIRILSPEDHLRVLCVHWLTNGGEDRERLWDIYYAVSNRPTVFDWSRCLDVVSAHRRGWIIATVGLAHKYLGLPIDDLPFADEARRLPRWLTECVEREWKKHDRLRPLHTALDDRAALIKQIRKRIPPNPILATIECEAPFDESSRLGYQIRDTFKRLGPSIRRVVPAMIRTTSRRK